MKNITNEADGKKEDKLCLVVFSGSLDKILSAFILATGAAASGMKVIMFFTFWATSAVKKPNPPKLKRTIIEQAFGWMLPRGSRKLPLSQMNMGGIGPKMIRHIMKQKNVASVEEMITMAGELGVEIRVCEMTMDLLGIKKEELIDYPCMSMCGVASVISEASSGSVTLFI